MPKIYMTEKEYEALVFLVGVARNVSDVATDEAYIKEFNEASVQFASLEKKYLKSNCNQRG
ncbi:hypothetical protein [Vibrio cholerae]|uniref:Uncharacterized protein n=1 Tax=Vibrio cholerae TaxID=666 RepID=A0ABD7SR41_VIBCL|nr:hypothetical protein [Vibrio cholerae]TXX67248.1 hypothetical protein FXF03_01355 [Vibrio cholerae]GIA99417.1 hypothetical protein VCSRO136_2333 [Vibrio cholerae]